jgi:hypothetical protein
MEKGIAGCHSHLFFLTSRVLLGTLGGPMHISCLEGSLSRTGNGKKGKQRARQESHDFQTVGLTTDVSTGQETSWLEPVPVQPCLATTHGKALVSNRELKPKVFLSLYGDQLEKIPRFQRDAEGRKVENYGFHCLIRDEELEPEEIW